MTDIPDDLRDALRPFIYAACVGSMIADEVDAAKPNQHRKRPLIAFGSYTGQYAAQSNVSWMDWKKLLDAAYAAGLLEGMAE